MTRKDAERFLQERVVWHKNGREYHGVLFGIGIHSAYVLADGEYSMQYVLFEHLHLEVM